jgi:hypothetical protein
MNTPPNPRSQPTKTLYLAYLVDRRNIQPKFFDLSGRLKLQKQDASMAKLAFNETIGGRRSAGLSYSDHRLAKRISLSLDANEKVLELENLVRLWGEVMKAVEIVRNNIKNSSEILRFVVSGFGTEEEKILCKKYADKVIDSVQQLYSGIRC